MKNKDTEEWHSEIEACLRNVILSFLSESAALYLTLGPFYAILFEGAADKATRWLRRIDLCIVLAFYAIGALIAYFGLVAVSLRKMREGDQHNA